MLPEPPSTKWWVANGWIFLLNYSFNVSSLLNELHINTKKSERQLVNPMWYSCDSHWRILFRLQLVLDLKLRLAQTIRSPTAHIALRLPVTCLRDQTSAQHGVLHDWTSHSDPSLLILCCIVTIPHLQLLRWECCMDRAGVLTHGSLAALVQLKCS